MPFRTVKLQPGVNIMSTPTLNQTNLADSNLVRFYDGKVQKIGGWIHMNDTPLVGICRGMWAWADQNQNVYTACGTDQRLQVLDGGTIVDITPLQGTSNVPVDFSMTEGSPVVTATDTTYQPSIGDWINLTTPVAIGDMILMGFYQVTGVIGGTQYTFNAANSSPDFTQPGFSIEVPHNTGGTIVGPGPYTFNLTYVYPNGVEGPTSSAPLTQTFSNTGTNSITLGAPQATAPGPAASWNLYAASGASPALSAYHLQANYTAFNTSETLTAITTSGVSPPLGPGLVTYSPGTIPSFTTTTGSAVVTVNWPGSNQTSGNTVNFPVSTSVGGLTISGEYTVNPGATANSFTISAASTATSNATASMNGGDAQIEYLIPSGFQVNTSLDGYGIGDYGLGDYGEAGSASIVGYLRQWSFGNWGLSLIASPFQGGIYFWTPPNVQPAQLVSSTAPIYNNAIFIIPQAQIIVALGAESGGTQNNLLVRWCDAGDFTDWDATPTNQAGSFLFSSGTTIMGGTPVGLGALIWTDTDVWYMQYIGFPLVFSFTQLAGSCGAMSQRGGADTAGFVIWLSTRGFFTYQAGGGVDAMESPVWDFIFENIDNTQQNQVHLAVNSLFSEMAWHFPIDPSSPLYIQGGPTTQLAYVKYNFVENAWDKGFSMQYQRTAWVEKNPQSYPAGTDFSGLIMQHEITNNADGQPMAWSFQTGYFSLMDGEEFVFVDLIIPDFALNNDPGSLAPVIQVSLLCTDYPIGLYQGSAALPAAQPLVDGPYIIDTNQPGASLMIPVRMRARQIALLFQGNDSGSFFRIGAIRVRFAPDGRN